MLSVDAQIVLAAIRGGFDSARFPARWNRAFGELRLAGHLAVTARAVEARPVTPVESNEPTVADVAARAPLSGAERAKKHREKKRALASAGPDAVTETRHASRDEVTAGVTAERYEAVDPSRYVPRVSLSLSSRDSSLSPSESPSSEPLDETPREGARDAGAAMASRADARAALATMVRRLYAARYEREWREMWPYSTGSEPYVDAVVSWAIDQPQPEMALARFIDGAFTPAKWRKPSCRAPWRFIAEDPGATASYSRTPSPSASQAARPRLHIQELPTDQDPETSIGVF